MQKTLSDNQDWVVMFLFGPQNPQGLYLEEKEISKYNEIRFYYYNVKFPEKHKDRFILNPPMIACYIGNKLINQLQYSSKESIIEHILNSFSKQSSKGSTPNHKKNSLDSRITSSPHTISLTIPPNNRQKYVYESPAEDTKRDSSIHLGSTRKTVSFGKINDGLNPDYENKVVYKSQRCSIVTRDSVTNHQLIAFLRNMVQNRFLKNTRTKRDFLFYFFYLRLMDKPIRLKKELNEDRLLKFLGKKMKSGVVDKKVKKYYKEIDLVEFVNLMKELGFLSKTECYEISSDLNEEKSSKREAYQKILRRFLVGKADIEKTR